MVRDRASEMVVVSTSRHGMARLHVAPGHACQGDEEAPSLDLAILDDEPTNLAAPIAALDAARDATAVNGAVVRQRRLYECAARARDRLAAVRPTLARLRSVLPEPHGDGNARDADLIVLAAADVARGLEQARRSVRALIGELTDLEAETRELIAVAARIEGGR